MIILTGSRAANLTGCLPDWRKGRMDDHDFYADETSARHIVEQIKSAHSYTEAAFDGAGGIIIADKSVRVSVVYPDEVYESLCRLDDNLRVTHLGIDCLAISEKTQLALKMGYIDRCKYHKAKNLNDIEFWSSRVSLDIQHFCVMAKMIEKAKRIFK